MVNGEVNVDTRGEVGLEKEGNHECLCELGFRLRTCETNGMREEVGIGVPVCVDESGWFAWVRSRRLTCVCRLWLTAYTVIFNSS